MFEERTLAKSDTPFEDISWDKRNLEIKDKNGEVVFDQKDVECPSLWSDLACRIAAKTYFYGTLGQDDRENSIRTMIERVATRIMTWGVDQKYFEGGQANNFYNDLCYILVHQMGAFNTPVWINFGTPYEQQGSACFISSVDDTLESLNNLHNSEIRIFERGSGNGVNMSCVRGSMEKLSGGGQAAGPLRFLKALDFSCGAMKSGGRARRGALMRILNIDHPDIVEYIHLKEKAEEMAYALIEAGFDSDWDSGIYNDIPWQNANNSVRVTDAFMEAIKEKADWELIARITGKAIAVHKAEELWNEICKAAWASGCPGIQFHDTINKWNTCKNDGDINASNPCSEFMFLDDTACNLASINLVKFQERDGRFDYESFRKVIKVLITAMDIIVDKASYPVEKIGEVTKKYRPLGLGFSNLGALLMRSGVPYNSESGRRVAATITAFMHGTACEQSAYLAKLMGPFERFHHNANCINDILSEHWKALGSIPVESPLPSGIDLSMKLMEDEVEGILSNVIEQPLRNAQLTLLAPCGTIGLLMDCDTTGVEPDLGLVMKKKVVDGGIEVIVNKSISTALERLGYGRGQAIQIEEHVRKEETIIGSKLKEEHLPVFETSLDDKLSISWQGHIAMIGAVTPFLSGSVSKTINAPNHFTPDDVRAVYESAYHMGLKSITVYRDGSKGSQPVNVGKKKKRIVATSLRKKLPEEAYGPRLRFRMGGMKVYAVASEFEDGSLGELFIEVGKTGSTVKGLYDVVATLFSIALQHGVPLKALLKGGKRQKFDPAGPVKLPREERPRIYTSVIDCIFQWLEKKYVKEDIERFEPIIQHQVRRGDEPICIECGAMMMRSGTCHLCPSCGTSSGCS